MGAGAKLKYLKHSNDFQISAGMVKGIVTKQNNVERLRARFPDVNLSQLPPVTLRARDH